jgi:ATP-dependent Clp protease ATP-binding subunit ClpA
MARVIREQIKKPLANELLFGQLVNGGKVWVKSEGEGLTFEFQPKVGAEKLEIA